MNHRSLITAFAAFALVLPMLAAPKTVKANSLVTGSATVAVAYIAESSITASAKAGTAALGQDNPLALPAGSVILTVESVELVGEGAVVVLESAVDGAEFVLRASRTLIEDEAFVAGTAIEAVAVGIGHVLTAGGRVVAFVPDQRSTGLYFSQVLGR